MNYSVKKRLLLLIAPIIAVILESLPYGVIMKFADGPDSTFTVTYSYFSLTPFGWAYYGPLPAAVLTCVLVILTLIYTARPTNALGRTAGILSIAAAILSASPIIFVFLGMALSDTFTLTGAAVTLLLILEGVLFLLPEKAKVITDRSNTEKTDQDK